MDERIGELLVRENLLTTEQLRKAREEAKDGGARLGAQITKLGFLQENELNEFVARQYGVPDINLDEFDIDPAVIQLIPEEVALKHTVIPVNRAGSTLILAISDPSNIFAIDDIKFLTGYNVEVVVASEEQIRRAIDRLLRQVLEPRRRHVRSSMTPTSSSSRTTTSTSASSRASPKTRPSSSS